MTVEEIKNIKKIEETLTGDTSNIEINASELNMAGSLAGLSIKLMDVMANTYQIHSNVVRLGFNLDTTVSTLNTAIRDFSGTLQELKMRMEDLESIKAHELGRSNR